MIEWNRMISQKIDDRYFIVNDHDVIKIAKLGDRWVCDCLDWIYNKKMGTLGNCKHIREVLK